MSVRYMARGPLLLVAAFGIVVGACEKPQAKWQYPAPSAATRPASVPPSDILTLATQADMNAAAKSSSDPAISKAVGAYLGPGAPRWPVAAARDVGDYVLLWIGFPDIADGGIDVIYSKPDQRIEWQFKGGVRG